jgi:hypothetical protein
MFSVTASGTIGDAIVYSNWKGLPYVRSRIYPAQPRTDAQQSQRTLLTSGVSTWQNTVYPAENSKYSWDMYASGTGMSGFNRYIKSFLELNKKCDEAPVIPQPGVGAMPGWVPWP